MRKFKAGSIFPGRNDGNSWSLVWVTGLCFPKAKYCCSLLSKLGTSCEATVSVSPVLYYFSSV